MTTPRIDDPLSYFTQDEWRQIRDLSGGGVADYVIDWLATERRKTADLTEKLRAKDEAIREAFNDLLDLEVHSTERARANHAARVLDRALSPDAGAGWLPPEEAEKLRAALRKVEHWMTDTPLVNTTTHAAIEESLTSGVKQMQDVLDIVRAALATPTPSVYPANPPTKESP